MKRVQEGKASSICDACWHERDDFARVNRRGFDKVKEQYPPFYCEWKPATDKETSTGCEKNHALLPENYRAWEVFQVVNGQRIVSDGAIVGLNHVAIWEYMDRTGVDDAVSVFHKVLAGEREMVEWQQDLLKSKSKG